MVRYELINPQLIVSPTASRVYRVCACLSVLLFVGWCAVLAGGSVPEMIGPFAPPLLFICVLGAAITIVGMEIFLFRFDNSHPLKQVFWFCVMLFPLLGAAVYCFAVYSRSDVIKARDELAWGTSV